MVSEEKTKSGLSTTNGILSNNNIKKGANNVSENIEKSMEKKFTTTIVDNRGVNDLSQ